MTLFLLSESGDKELLEVFGYLEAQKPVLQKNLKGNPLLAAALEKSTFLTFRDGFEGQVDLPEDEGIWMAMPMNVLSSKKVFGAICINRIPFLAMNAANVRILGIIADWAARALEKTQLFRDLRARELDDKLTGVYTFAYFNLRFPEEMSRAQRHQVPLTLVLFNILEFDLMDPPRREDLLSIIGLVFNHVIRDVDIPCRYRSPSTFALILPLCDNSGANVLIDKLRANIDSYGFKPFPDDRELKVRLIAHSFKPLTGGTPIRSVDQTQVLAFLEEADRKVFRE